MYKRVELLFISRVCVQESERDEVSLASSLEGRCVCVQSNDLDACAMPSSESEVSSAVSRQQQYWASRLKLLKIYQITVVGVRVVVGGR